jgi:endogenous inhibitor of DNA gyrase (YacG/DUF329 family)
MTTLEVDFEDNKHLSIDLGDWIAETYVGDWDQLFSDHSNIVHHLRTWTYGTDAEVTNFWLQERRECPACGTRVDEDGYCTDVGCPWCGKVPPKKEE